MRIVDIMSAHPKVLTCTQSIKDAVRLFLDYSIDGAPVVDENNELIGLFTKTHVYRAIDQELDLSVPISQLMTRDPLTVDINDDVENVIYPELGRLPVVRGKTVVGMMTRTDLVKAFYHSYNVLSSEINTIINSTHNMIVSVDIKGRIKVFNKSAEKYLGKRAEDVIGQKIWEVFPTSGLVDTIKMGKVELLQKFVMNGRNFISNRSPIVKDGQIIGSVAVLQDISEFEHISQELKYVKELNEELDAIIDSSFDGLYITDGTGKTLRVNRAYEMIMGINKEEFIGRNVEEIRDAGIVSESVTYLTLQRRSNVTIIQNTKTGKTTLVTGSPVFDKNGKIVRVVCNVRDITELSILRQKLEQAQGLSQHYESELKTLRLKYLGTASLAINSNVMRNLLDTVIRLAQVDTTVLITGESGTGKELIAETIHNNSSRKNQPFIKVNCGAIPANLLESELFGYEFGAFSGAKKGGKAGYFELANKGTLFLDEIGDLPFNLQVKLLRVLQSKEIIRVGGESSFKIDVRILAATNKNLKEMVANKEFREDLYYRLNVIPVQIPPLRERKEDIPALVVHFMQAFNRKYEMNKRISPEVLHIFMGWNWPGNVRELENLIERLVVVTPKDIISSEDLLSYFDEAVESGHSPIVVRALIPLKEAIESTERQILERAYCQYKTTRQMAVALKINASTVVRKAARYGINVKAEI